MKIKQMKEYNRIKQGASKDLAVVSRKVSNKYLHSNIKSEGYKTMVEIRDSDKEFVRKNSDIKRIAIIKLSHPLNLKDNREYSREEFLNAPKTTKKPIDSDFGEAFNLYGLGWKK